MCGRVTSFLYIIVSDYTAVSVPGGLAWFCRPLACWDCGSNPAGDHRGLSFVSVVFCQVEGLITRPEESYGGSVS